jgi:exosortase E/protease (VPEID-CTERM system)
MVVVAEYLTLSFLVDLPTVGPALHVASALRLAIPVVLAALAAGWILARVPSAVRDGAALELEAPAWRPLPTLALQVAAFAIVAGLAHQLLREDAPPPTPTALLALVAAFGVVLLLAIASAAPLTWIARAAVRRWRAPVLALAVGTLAWRAAVAAESLWGVLSGFTLRASAWLLTATPYQVFVDAPASLLGAGDFLIHVAPVCSGADGLGLVALFQATWLALARARLRFPRALLLLPVGAIAALAANVVRISVLMWAGASGNVALASGGLHSKLGWILFIALALGTVAVAERWEWLQRAPAGEARASNPWSPTAAGAYVGPLLAMLFASLVTSAFSAEDRDPWYAIRVAAGVAALFAARRLLPRPQLSASWVAAAAGVALGVGWVWAEGGGPSGASEVAAGAHAPGLAWILLRVAGSCILIPIAEELAFRGFLLRWLVSPDFERVPPRAWNAPAVLLSSAAFGALHSQWLLGTLAGVVFAALLLWRGRLSDAIVAHATANAAIAIAVLSGGRWHLWS